ncbi:MAG: 50S ribosomal protein L30 [Spirochaetaceae bacterium]|jgi:large subunit ribosomal protein L30|nr:50S ribosomal protein L30 [Spirochaetaceae bacterium]MBR3812921.1 50S ribosomal protein L30 [Spirochaetaceae bacterium]MDD6487983.1 50S ribosomal protein L30 [Spirochaetales bacterium]
MAKAKKLKITLVRSTISQKPAVVATVKSLGLRKISSSVEQNATPDILGKIRAVAHLVEVEEMK